MKEEYEIKKGKDLEILKWTVTSLRATVSFKQEFFLFFLFLTSPSFFYVMTHFWEKKL